MPSFRNLWNMLRPLSIINFFETGIACPWSHARMKSQGENMPRVP
ncbi:hypothetical protein Tsubulata_002641, partial [Turnera subulata]